MSSMEIFDKYGRSFQLTRENWRTEVLPAALRSNWDNADALYAGILQALNDDFVDEVAEATEQLRALEPDSARSAAALAYVKLKRGQVDEAQSLLEGYLAAHGPESAVLNNLAKVHAERGDDDLVERTLWRSLEADPNNENSVGWFEALHRERGGSAAVVEALRRIATLPRSWRARVGLARHALDARDTKQASALHQEALRILGADIPADALMTITGDLGKRGFLAQLLEIAVPRFAPEKHGIVVGNNLIKAYLDSGRFADARALVERLFAMDRPDWKSSLTFWDGQVMQAETSRNVQLGPTIEMTMYVIEGPAWAHAGSPVARLFPPAPEGAPRVVFMGSTAEVAEAPATPQVQLSDAAGRLARFLPLYLAEQSQFHGGAHVRGLFPWIVNAVGGSFVLTTAPPSDRDALQRARAGGPCDFVVLTHVKARAEPWSAALRLLRASDGRCVFQCEERAPSTSLETMAANLAARLREALSREERFIGNAPRFYAPPAPPHLANYLLRLEQLLALRCATSAAALHGVREILEGNLHLCLDCPDNVTTRALLADVVARMRNVRPDVVAQYRDRVLLLQKELPLPEEAQRVLDDMLGAAMDGRRAAG